VTAIKLECFLTDTESSYFLPSFIKSRARTRIVCTIGPATGTLPKIKRLIRAGMSVARLNLSHGSTKDHDEYVKLVRQASLDLGVSTGILADIPGPKYRVGEMEEPEIELITGQSFVLQIDACKGNKERANVWPVGLHSDIKVGSPVLIDEGSVQLRVESINGTDITCKVTMGGVMKPNKAVTAPGNTTTVDYFTPETVEALDWINGSDVDFVGVSYVRDAEDLKRVREHLGGAAKSPQLVSKIEIQQAVDNLASILEETEAVMVARGDLGVELPFERVPSVQKRIIRMANEAGKPVITATQMLESMIEAPAPTRAEATDVYNAVRDGSDAVMLSGETSVGKFPFNAVSAMAKIAKRAEGYMDHPMLAARRRESARKQGVATDEAIADSATSLASSLKAKAIVAFTESGSTAGRLAAYRPEKRVYALTPRFDTGARLALRWGVTVIAVENLPEIQNLFFTASDVALQTGIAKENDAIVTVAGLPIGIPGTTNVVRVINLPEPRQH